MEASPGDLRLSAMRELASNSRRWSAGAGTAGRPGRPATRTTPMPQSTLESVRDEPGGLFPRRRWRPLWRWRQRPSSPQTPGHRLTLRQRLGLDAKPVDQARRDEEQLLLPPRLDYFPDPALNRDLYFWLAAFLAVAEAPTAYDDPLQQDLAALGAADQAGRQVCETLSGLAQRYRRLCEALADHPPAPPPAPECEAARGGVHPPPAR
ncbi:MAG: hypothetical protein U5L11_17560 [Arhodomonas sp.]|nr:hypothetical protein [Arhodomonas sp.]